ncbi:hypothetical protein BOTCAL_0154g00080 [Botryotinia calthae]|uniref:Carboxylic ester hydrolase n=1 Tax=Botryotinia calthae TaxID=38488 RepID=A0A4Y8D2B2_9HELO|nr:hypothetical protein BOTCAL_0154g00080 [Botryotinia calthae]
MRRSITALATFATSASVATTITESLVQLCTDANVKAALPADGTFAGITMVSSLTSANVVYNAADSVLGGEGTTGPWTHCNATVYYTHTGSNDSVFISYALPAPSAFKNRFYVQGGQAYSLSSDPLGGLTYRAVEGMTSAGYDSANSAFDEAALLGNGTINWPATYMFGYQAIGEMTIIGKALTKAIYDIARQGMSQVQRWGEEYDGAITGAPAFRYGQQQTAHMFPADVEQTLHYYPPPCKLDQIVTAIIAAYLCSLEFDFSSIVGQSYYCAAQNSTSLGFGFSKRQVAGSSTTYQPAQNGIVSAEGVAVVKTIYNGLFNSKGQRAYLSWQIDAELSDAETQYDSDSNSWVIDTPSTGGEYVAKLIGFLNIDNLASIDNVTYDTMVEWMNTGMIKYYDSLQTTLPDLTPFQSSGGKLLHYHGESDPSIPTAPSVHYW